MMKIRPRKLMELVVPSGQSLSHRLLDRLLGSRKTMVRNSKVRMCLTLAPGPGAYRLFSEFGQYESRNASRFEEKYGAIYSDTMSKKEKREKVTQERGRVEIPKPARTFNNTEFKVTVFLI
jgi:hypothetical protein